MIGNTISAIYEATLTDNATAFSCIQTSAFATINEPSSLLVQTSGNYETPKSIATSTEIPSYWIASANPALPTYCSGYVTGIPKILVWVEDRTAYEENFDAVPSGWLSSVTDNAPGVEISTEPQLPSIELPDISIEATGTKEDQPPGLPIMTGASSTSALLPLSSDQDTRGSSSTPSKTVATVNYAPVITPPATLTFHGSIITAGSNSAFVIDGQTLALGKVITVDGTTVSLGPSEVVIGTSTQALGTVSSIEDQPLPSGQTPIPGMAVRTSSLPTLSTLGWIGLFFYIAHELVHHVDAI